MPYPLHRQRHTRSPLAARIKSFLSNISDNLLTISDLKYGSFVAGTSTAITIVLSIPISVWLLESTWDSKYAGQSWLFTLPMDFLARWGSSFFMTTGFRLYHRLTFMETWSVLLRRLVGITGSLYEFFSKYIMMMSLFHVFKHYALGEYDPKGTYKPPWTEYLG
jgi:hypothetical protein